MTATETVEHLSNFPFLSMAILVLLVEWLLPLPTRINTSHLFGLFANAIRQKLRISRPAINHKQYGVLALLFYILFICIILFACLFAFENDIWMSGFLFYLSLNLSTFQKTVGHIVPMLDNSQKTSARSLLSSTTHWDTQKLSVLGLTKLTTELLVFRFVHGWLMPLIMFFLFGGVASFLYMTLVSANIAWTGSDNTSRQFGWFSYCIRDFLAFIPSIILAPVFSVFKSSPSWLDQFNVIKQQWRLDGWSRVELLWLSVLSAGTKSELAGPLMLNDIRLARPKLNPGKGVKTTHIEIATNWILRFKSFTLVLLSLVLTLVITL